MPRSLDRIGKCAVPVLALCALTACGEDTKPHPAFADPCTTPMGGVLSCPPQAINPPTFTIGDACRKLTTCGILAENNLRDSGTPCSSTDECNKEGHGPGRECLPNASGNPMCFAHSLDYYWCMLRFSELGSDPCDDQVRFTAAHLQATIDCIAANSCNVLGASFSEKAKRESGKFADNDKYVCKKDGKTTIWTATICDGGLLNYDRYSPPST